MTIRIPQVGESLHLATKNGLARKGVKEYVCIVTAVGAEYFEVETQDVYPFSVTMNLDGWENKSSHVPVYQAYPKTQSMGNMVLAAKLHNAIHNYFAETGKAHLELSRLEQIAKIMDLEI